MTNPPVFDSLSNVLVKTVVSGGWLDLVVVWERRAGAPHIPEEIDATPAHSSHSHIHLIPRLFTSQGLRQIYCFFFFAF